QMVLLIACLALLFTSSSARSGSKCWSIEAPMVQKGGWSIPELAIPTSKTRPRSSQTLTIEGVPVVLRFYKGTRQQYSLAPLLDANIPGSEMATTLFFYAYLVRGRLFCLYLLVLPAPVCVPCKDDPGTGCEECHTRCGIELALYDKDGDGSFETLESPHAAPPRWVPDLPDWVHSMGTSSDRGTR
ncbi:MAG: hypothetical protein MUF51_10430, partial [Vicinamibacteria bacterium]|nr:hypothetical protein [Vicinamibacteria bacterium]